TNCTLATSSFANLDIFNFWPAQGTQSLLVTSTAVGAFSVHSPPPSPPAGLNIMQGSGDIITAGADVFAPVAIPAAYLGIQFWTATGTAIGSPVTGTAIAVGGNSSATVTAKAAAPATAAFFSLYVGNSDAASPASTQLYIDNVRVSPRMGTQTREAYLDYLHQIQALEQGMLKEAKTLWGLAYKTRLSLISQPVAVTLDYSAGQVSPPLQPVQDDKLTVNHVTVKRTEGSRVTVSQ